MVEPNNIIADTKLFTDEKLNKLMKSQHPYIIMTFSPLMPLSVKAIKNTREAAKKLDVEILILIENKMNGINQEFMDFNSSIEEPIQYNQSNTLLSRGASLHYPSIFFLNKGTLLDYEKFGYETTENYLAEFSSVFQKSKSIRTQYRFD